MVWTLKSSDELVELIAEHLGDIEAIKNLETLSMQGYGQYAYMWGGGNISSSPLAPQKYIAANALQRNWNLKEETFQMKERRNMLFPFASEFGHSYFPNDNRLHKDVAYDYLPNQHFTTFS